MNARNGRSVADLAAPQQELPVRKAAEIMCTWQDKSRFAHRTNALLLLNFPKRKYSTNSGGAETRSSSKELKKGI